jgi:Spy/CpxP family protein refolding chaperone
MSFGVSSASLFGSASQTDGSSNTSLRPFANLNLSEAQRTQIRSIFQNAKSQGLSQSEVQQQIGAILTPAQQTTLQSNLAAQNSTSSVNSAPSQSSTAQSTNGTPPPPGGNLFTNPNGPFANLNLSSDQQTQISQLLQDGKSQGLSRDQINSQISALLTPAQQTAFATDLQNVPSRPGSQNPAASTNGPIDNLNLTDDQQSKIDTILQSAQTNGTSQSDVLAQIQGVLSPNQQSAFLQDVQTAQAVVSGQSQNGSGETGSSSTLSSTLTETDVQNQIAAATSLLIQQFQSNLPTT